MPQNGSVRAAPLNGFLLPVLRNQDGGGATHSWNWWGLELVRQVPGTQNDKTRWTKSSGFGTGNGERLRRLYFST